MTLSDALDNAYFSPTTDFKEIPYSLVFCACPRKAPLTKKGERVCECVCDRVCVCVFCNSLEKSE